VTGGDWIAALLAGGGGGALLLALAGAERTPSRRRPSPKEGGALPCPGRREERRLERSLPAALERVASGISAGYSIQKALSVLAETPRHPLAPILSSVLTRVRAGDSLEEALRRQAAVFRRRSLPLALLTMASATRSGSNLVESLHLLARVCRDREALRGKIEALTAQSRLQGLILSLVPLLFLGALALVSPGCLSAILHSAVGRMLLGASFLLQALGGFVIHRMVSREVF